MLTVHGPRKREVSMRRRSFVLQHAVREPDADARRDEATYAHKNTDELRGREARASRLGLAGGRTGARIGAGTAECICLRCGVGARC